MGATKLKAESSVVRSKGLEVQTVRKLSDLGLWSLGVKRLAVLLHRLCISIDTQSQRKNFKLLKKTRQDGTKMMVLLQCSNILEPIKTPGMNGQEVSSPCSGQALRRGT